MFNSFASQPLPILKVISEGFKLFSQTFSKIWYWSFLFHTIHSLPNFIAFFKGQAAEKSVFSVGHFLLFLVVMMIQAYAAAFLTHRMYRLVVTPKAPTLVSLKFATQKWLSVFLAVLMLGLVLGTLASGALAVSFKFGLAAGLLLAIFPVFLSVLWILYLPLILFEQQSAPASLKNSALLVWGHWWETLLIPLIPILIGLALVMFALLIQPSHSLGVIFSMVIASSLTTPLLYALMLTQFNNLQLKKNQKGLSEGQ